MNKVNVTFFIDEESWSRDDITQIEKDFGDLKPKQDIKAAIGAGASGLYPEFNLLLLISVSIVANGFLSAMGKDAWVHFKNGLKRILKSKPIKIAEEIPQELKQPKFDLIWWIQARDVSFMVVINAKTDEEIDLAIRKLPGSIDSAIKNKKQFSRIFWNGVSWELF